MLLIMRHRPRVVVVVVDTARVVVVFVVDTARVVGWVAAMVAVVVEMTRVVGRQYHQLGLRTNSQTWCACVDVNIDITTSTTRILMW